MNPHLGPATVPDPSLSAVQALCDVAAPYDHSDEDLFLAAVNESNRWHAERNDFFRSLWTAIRRAPSDMSDDLASSW